MQTYKTWFGIRSVIYVKNNFNALQFKCTLPYKKPTLEWRAEKWIRTNRIWYFSNIVLILSICHGKMNYIAFWDNILERVTDSTIVENHLVWLWNLILFSIINLAGLIGHCWEYGSELFFSQHDRVTLSTENFHNKIPKSYKTETSHWVHDIVAMTTLSLRIIQFNSLHATLGSARVYYESAPLHSGFEVLV